MRSDGGGKASAATHPLYGRQTVMRFLLGIYNKRPPDMTAEFTEVNGAPALVVRVDGKIENVMSFAIGGEQIEAIHIVRNPEKLRHLQ